MTSNFVRIFDTTLRDGEQSPGATMTSAEKLEVARRWRAWGSISSKLDFPAASPDDLEAVRRIAIEVGRIQRQLRPPSHLWSGAHCCASDIEKCWEAVQPAEHPRIHTFLATSEIHMQYKLKMTREQVIERVREMVAFAHSLCEDVEFSPEDAGRSDPSSYTRCLAEAIRAGATTLNIPDTVGYTTTGRVWRIDRRDHARTPPALKNALFPSTATTIWDWPPPIPWQGSAPAPARLR